MLSELKSSHTLTFGICLSVSGYLLIDVFPFFSSSVGWIIALLGLYIVYLGKRRVDDEKKKLEKRTERLPLRPTRLISYLSVIAGLLAFVSIVLPWWSFSSDVLSISVSPASLLKLNNSYIDVYSPAGDAMIKLSFKALGILPFTIAGITFLLLLSVKSRIVRNAGVLALIVSIMAMLYWRFFIPGYHSGPQGFIVIAYVVVGAVLCLVGARHRVARALGLLVLLALIWYFTWTIGAWFNWGWHKGYSSIGGLPFELLSGGVLVDGVRYSWGVSWGFFFAQLSTLLLASSFLLEWLWNIHYPRKELAESKKPF